jgi:hypothetical protein
MNGKIAKLIRKFAKKVHLKSTRGIKRVWQSGNQKERAALRKELQATIDDRS